MQTKACSLTEDEIITLIRHHAKLMWNDDSKDYAKYMERLKYLNGRLKEFDKITSEATTEWR